MTNAKTPALLVAVAALLGACSSTPVAPPPDAARPVVAAAQTTSAPARTPAPAVTKPAPVSTVATVTLPEYLDPKSSLSAGRSLYFDFDDYSIKTEFSALVERHGKYLSTHPSVSIRVEGNADERGSAEYNLALGQKRAQAVVRALKIYGVKDAQVEAVSWGEEKPKANSHDESAWAQNRRADLQYPAK
jgi:peptidoglycan-associated lipoprotein